MHRRLKDSSALASCAAYWLLAGLIIANGGADAASCGCFENAASYNRPEALVSNNRGDKRNAGSAKPELLQWQNNAVKIDDMVIPYEDFEFDQSSSKTPQGHTDVRRETNPQDYINCRRLWPNGQLDYSFDSDYPDEKKTVVRDALTKLSTMTDRAVQFIEIANDNESVQYNVQVIADVGCYSHVGRTRKDQALSLPSGCLHESTIQHEFMHALGFMHEQSRLDRDDYVRIYWGHIRSDMCFNFYKAERQIPADYPGYDYKSIMHYTSWAFRCRRGWDTITMKNGTDIQRNMAVTDLDVEKIKYMYSPKNLAFCSSAVDYN